MSEVDERSLLAALTDSWNRNNTILLNLLQALPAGGLQARAAPGSPSVAEMFTHMHYVRMVLLSEDAPEYARPVDYKSWKQESDPGRIAAMLRESASCVLDAFRGRLQENRAMDRHYDHPVLFLQHMIWHEGYHHGQIKLALKLNGHTLPDKVAGPLTWQVWMNKH